MCAEIDGIEANRLLNSCHVELNNYFVTKYQFKTLSVREGEISVEQAETRWMSKERYRYISDMSRPFHIAGTPVTLCVPFDGNSSSRKYLALCVTVNPPPCYARSRGGW